MQDMNITTVSGCILVVLALVSAIKSGWKTWTEGKEPRLALVFGVLVVIAAKVTGAMDFKPGAPGWVDCVFMGFMVGMLAGIAHDKGVNALAGKIIGPLASKDGIAPCAASWDGILEAVRGSKAGTEKDYELRLQELQIALNTSLSHFRDKTPEKVKRPEPPQP